MPNSKSPYSARRPLSGAKAIFDLLLEDAHRVIVPEFDTINPVQPDTIIAEF